MRPAPERLNPLQAILMVLTLSSIAWAVVYIVVLGVRRSI